MESISAGSSLISESLFDGFLKIGNSFLIEFTIGKRQAPFKIIPPPVVEIALYNAIRFAIDGVFRIGDRSFPASSVGERN